MTTHKLGVVVSFFIASYALSTGVSAQNGTENKLSLASDPALTPHWQHCRVMPTDADRLHCFDQWAAQNQQAIHALEQPVVSPVDHPITAHTALNCKSAGLSELSRFWELEQGSDCGTFGIRGYKPINLSWTSANTVNTQPDSASFNHTASQLTPYSIHEARIQLSVRTKIAQGLLPQSDVLRRDSLWFGYSQQSYWQLFNSDLSRPFRSTDHEPEIIYVYPTDVALPGTWRWRYAGLSLNHQSNGQSEPLSRSWNRQILMAGFENQTNWRIQMRWWWRIPESASDDDNPDIDNLIGRTEVSALWDMNTQNTLGLTLRHSLRAQMNGSIRMEWLKAITQANPVTGSQGLRFHTELFSGYGDSLLDYNRRRTVFSVGLSLVDW